VTVIGLAIVVAVRAAAAAAHATVLPWMSLEDVTAKAELIVLGRVETSVAGWSDDGRIIVTRATVSVERALKGGPRARVEVEAPGGRIGDVGMIAAGAPVFHVGDRVVLFLEAAGSGAGGGAPRRHAVVGWNLGKMDVTRDPRTGRDLVRDRTSGALYLDRQGRPVASERAGKGPSELGEFLRHVETLVASGPQGKGP